MPLVRRIQYSLLIFVPALVAGIFCFPWAGFGEDSQSSLDRSSSPSAEQLYQQHIQDIFDNFDRIMQEHDRAFDHFFDEDEPTPKEYEAMQRQFMTLLQESSRRNPGAVNPNAFFNGSPGISYDVSKEEKDGKWIYRINVPDLENKNLRIEVKDGLLRISEERKQQGEQSYLFGQFQKVIPLPEGIDPASVQYKKEKDQIVVIIPKDGQKS